MSVECAGRHRENAENSREASEREVQLANRRFIHFLGARLRNRLGVGLLLQRSTCILLIVYKLLARADAAGVFGAGAHSKCRELCARVSGNMYR